MNIDHFIRTVREAHADRVFYEQPANELLPVCEEIEALRASKARLLESLKDIYVLDPYEAKEIARAAIAEVEVE